MAHRPSPPPLASQIKQHLSGRLVILWLRFLVHPSLFRSRFITEESAPVGRVRRLSISRVPHDIAASQAPRGRLSVIVDTVAEGPDPDDPLDFEEGQ